MAHDKLTRRRFVYEGGAAAAAVTLGLTATPTIRAGNFGDEKAKLGRAMRRAWANLPDGYQWLKDWEYV